MILNSKIQSKLKELLKIPIDDRFAQFGWNGVKSVFHGHVLLTWENFNSFINSDREYQALNLSNAYKSGQLVTDDEKYYRCLIDLSESDTKQIDDETQFKETSLAFELVESLIDKSIEEVFDKWEENLTLETEQSTQLEVLNTFVGNEDSTVLDGSDTIKTIISKNNTDPNTKMIINQIGVYSREDITDQDITITDGVESVVLTEKLIADQVNIIVLDDPFETYQDKVEISTVNDSFLISDTCNSEYNYMFLETDRGGESRYTEASFLPHLQLEVDYTEVICNNLSRFVRAIQMQFAVFSLEYMAYNPHNEINRNEANITKEDLIFELDIKDYTVRTKASKAIKSIGSDFFPKDGIVIGCALTSGSVTYTAM